MSAMGVEPAVVSLVDFQAGHVSTTPRDHTINKRVLVNMCIREKTVTDHMTTIQKLLYIMYLLQCSIKDCFR